MARYFAKIEDNVVTQVIVADTKKWCSDTLDGTWVETFKDKDGHNYASKGYTYHADRKNFAPPQPYPSWTLGDDCRWVAPVPMPEHSRATWDEEKLEWVIFK